jgi:hypothetical protein
MQRVRTFCRSSWSSTTGFGTVVRHDRRAQPREIIAVGSPDEVGADAAVGGFGVTDAVPVFTHEPTNGGPMRRVGLVWLCGVSVLAMAVMGVECGRS